MNRIRRRTTSVARVGPVCLRSRTPGTVREDYSAWMAYAWDFLPHDLARSKAYRWGEDSIAGICDRYQIMVFALAFWNGRDPILQAACSASSRATAITAKTSNNATCLDSTPTHSYRQDALQVSAGRLP